MVSSKGRILDTKRNVFMPTFPNKGYLILSLGGRKDRRSASVHRLVAIAFRINPDPEHKTQVNHKDENKQNNDVNNLEWVTPKENLNWGTINERISKRQLIPIVQLDKDGELIKCWTSAKEASEYGYNRGRICECAKNKMPYYKGYKWMYLKDYSEFHKGEKPDVMTISANNIVRIG